VGVFCGIGNPESFVKHLELNGHAICYQRAFADHHDYQQQEIDEVISAARTRGAKALLTTQKDAVKLRSLAFDMPCYVVEIGLVIKDESEFRRLIRSAISAKPKHS
jgi:tetraacyldisaccharide 4'-kinase